MRFRVMGLGLVALAVLAFVAFAVNRSSDKPKSARASSDRSSKATKGATSTTNALAGAGIDQSELSSVDAKKSATGVFGADRIPMSISVSDTSNLRSGDPVGIHLEADSGSLVYGFEAFLCRSGETYAFDADIRPTLTGKCAHEPLAPGADDYLEVRAQPPYDHADGVFRVGVGADSFTTSDGRTTTVQCDDAHPCVVVAKVQFPNGYGFQSIPVTFK